MPEPPSFSAFWAWAPATSFHMAKHGPHLPLRVPLAYLTAIIELAGGIALLLAPHRTRRRSQPLTIVYSVFTFIWVPKAFVNLRQLRPHRQCL